MLSGNKKSSPSRSSRLRPRTSGEWIRYLIPSGPSFTLFAFRKRNTHIALILRVEPGGYSYNSYNGNRYSGLATTDRQLPTKANKTVFLGPPREEKRKKARLTKLFGLTGTT